MCYPEEIAFPKLDAVNWGREDLQTRLRLILHFLMQRWISKKNSLGDRKDRMANLYENEKA